MALFLPLLGAECAQDPTLTVAAFGDSLTNQGPWFRPPIPSDWAMLDFGEDGDECWNDVADRVVAEAPGLAADVVVIWCGTNDVRKAAWESAERSLDEIERALLAARDAGSVVVLVAPPPIFTVDGSPATLANTRLFELRDGLFELAASHDVALADVWTSFWLHPAPSLLYRDGVHPNVAGRDIEAQLLWWTIDAEWRRQGGS